MASFQARLTVSIPIIADKQVKVIKSKKKIVQAQINQEIQFPWSIWNEKSAPRQYALMSTCIYTSQKSQASFVLGRVDERMWNTFPLMFKLWCINAHDAEKQHEMILLLLPISKRNKDGMKWQKQNETEMIIG